MGPKALDVPAAAISTATVVSIIVGRNVREAAMAERRLRQTSPWAIREVDRGLGSRRLACRGPQCAQSHRAPPLSRRKKFAERVGFLSFPGPRTGPNLNETRLN
jgi:hypothetical protein